MIHGIRIFAITVEIGFPSPAVVNIHSSRWQLNDSWMVMQIISRFCRFKFTVCARVICRVTWRIPDITTPINSIFFYFSKTVESIFKMDLKKDLLRFSFFQVSKVWLDDAILSFFFLVSPVNKRNFSSKSESAYRLLSLIKVFSWWVMKLYMRKKRTW